MRSLALRASKETFFTTPRLDKAVLAGSELRCGVVCLFFEAPYLSQICLNGNQKKTPFGSLTMYTHAHPCESAAISCLWILWDEACDGGSACCFRGLSILQVNQPTSKHDTSTICGQIARFPCSLLAIFWCIRRIMDGKGYCQGPPLCGSHFSLGWGLPVSQLAVTSASWACRAMRFAP